MANDDDDEYIGFNISQRDLDDEFNINRATKRQSKNQAIYGIWADPESDEEESGETKAGYKNNVKKSFNFTAPVGFVKGGYKDDDDHHDESANKPREKPPKESESRTTTSNKKQKQQHRFAGTKNFASQSGDAEFGQWEMYTKGIGSKLLQKMGYQPGKGLGKNQQGITAPIEAKKRPGAGAIGAYGPEAKGPPLRKDGKKSKNKTKMDDEDEAGEAEAAGSDDSSSGDDDDATTRGKAWKKGQQKVKKVKIYTQSDQDMISEGLQNSWNSSTADSSATRVKIIDMTGPEQRILGGLSQLHTSRALKPREDYTPTAMNTRFDMPELTHNLERLIRLSVNKLVKGDQDYHRDLKQIESLREEEQRLEKLIQDEEWQLEQLDQYDTFAQAIEDICAEDVFGDRNGDGEEGGDDDESESRIGAIEAILPKFEQYYTEDLKRGFARAFGLDELLRAALAPRLRRALHRWRPFNDNFNHDDANDNDRICGIFRRIKSLVCRAKTFDTLLWDYWNGPVCRALQQWPSMKRYEPIARFVKRWRPILPTWLFEYFIANHLLPRMTREVEQWEPSRDPVPIHQWTLPWPTVLLDASVAPADIESLFEPIYDIVRQKLTKALGPWQPSPDDHSVLKMIELWKGAFSDAAFHNFIDANIVPKLDAMMRSAKINPQRQSLAEWNWVAAWRPLLGAKVMSSIIARCFIPNWLFTLHNWLAQAVVNFAEVQAWYREWKERFGDLVHEPPIKDSLNKALSMMHHRVDSNIGLKHFAFYHHESAEPIPIAPIPAQPIPPIPPPQPSSSSSSSSYQPYGGHIPFSIDPSIHPIAPSPAAFDAMLQSEPINFRQMVEMKAAESGIIFMPIANRFQDGKQVFQFGQYLVYIDSQVLFLQRFVNGNRVWAPIRLQEVIDLCHAAGPM